MRHLIVLSALIVLLGPSLSAQTGLRGWHADGQTWLVWNDDQTFVGNDSYSIYRATSPITNLAQAERIRQALSCGLAGTATEAGARWHDLDLARCWGRHVPAGS